MPGSWGAGCWPETFAGGRKKINIRRYNNNTIRRAVLVPPPATIDVATVFENDVRLACAASSPGGTDGLTIRLCRELPGGDGRTAPH